MATSRGAVTSTTPAVSKHSAMQCMRTFCARVQVAHATMHAIPSEDTSQKRRHQASHRASPRRSSRACPVWLHQSPSNLAGLHKPERHQKSCAHDRPNAHAATAHQSRRPGMMRARAGWRWGDAPSHPLCHRTRGPRGQHRRSWRHPPQALRRLQPCRSWYFDSRTAQSRPRARSAQSAVRRGVIVRGIIVRSRQAGILTTCGPPSSRARSRERPAAGPRVVQPRLATRDST